MSIFTAPFDTRFHPETKEWEILTAFEFHSGEPNSGLFSYMEVGDRTDAASIPPIIRMLIPKVGRDIQGAGIHDKGYRTGKLRIRIPLDDGSSVEEDVSVTKGMIDSMYYEAMLVLKVNPIRREVIRAGLVCFGFYTWNKYRALES